MKKYCSNGFIINSDIHLYGWLEIEYRNSDYNDSDYLCLTLERRDFYIEMNEKNWPNIYKHRDGYICFTWNERISILILSNKKDILYMYDKNVNEIEITFALNFVLSYIAQIHNCISLHGCSFSNTNNEATIIVGESGNGKSTLLYNFLQKGIEFLSEEICFIDLKEPIQAYCSNRIIRLSDDIYRGAKNDIIYYTGDGKVSFWNNEYSFSNSPKKLKNIVLLNRNKDANKDYIHHKSKIDAMSTIFLKYLYTKSIINWIPFETICKNITHLMSNVDIYEYEYKRFPDAEFLLSSHFINS